jgi:hypothetical protein
MSRASDDRRYTTTQEGTDTKDSQTPVAASLDLILGRGIEA